MSLFSINGYGYFNGATKFMQLQYFLNTDIYNRLKSASLNERLYYYQNSSNDTSLTVAKVVNEFLGDNVINNKVRMYSCPYNASETDFTKGMRKIFDYSPEFLSVSTNTMSQFVTLDNKTMYSGKQFPASYSQADMLNGYSYQGEFIGYPETLKIWYYLPIFPDDFFIGSQMNMKYATVNDNQDAWIPTLEVLVTAAYTDPTDPSKWYAKNISIYRSNLDYFCNMKSFNDIGITPVSTEVDDTDNPYGGPGNSHTGGGNGTLTDPDITEPVDIPDLPTISAADLGFITMYNPTKSQLKSLSDFMWSNLFDLATYKKLFSDPMQSIIGLAIVPVSPDSTGSKNVMFGSIDSGVSMPTCSQYVQLDCGSVDIQEWIGSFLDYSPYTKISLYLPYIGIHELSADDIMGGSIQVVYNIDCLSGACGCFVKHSSRGVLYSYNGSCITNVPLTSVNFSSAIQNAVSAVCSGAGIIAGIATGAAPITAMSAAGLLNSAANTALNSKPSVQRSGSLGGSAGILSVQTPYVIIERPNMSVPANVQNYAGQVSNITMSLGACRGFTMVEFIHLHNVTGTSEEIKEIEALLKEGVIL